MIRYSMGMIAILGLFYAGLAHGADDPVGQIVKVRNDVRITRLSGRTIAAEGGSALLPGDAIATGEKSAAGFSLDGGGYFQMGERSEVIIDELSGLEGEGDAQPVLRQALGYLRSLVSGTGSHARPVVHTATAVVGVRGTTFETIVSLGGETAVVVDDGVVELDNETDVRMIHAGEMAELDPKSESVTASPAPPKAERDWNRWLGARKSELIPKIPGTLDRYRNRVEKWTGRYNELLAEVRKKHNGLSDAVAAVRTAKRRRNGDAIRSAVDVLKDRRKRLFATLKDARRRMNRFQTIGGQVKKVGLFSWRHRFAFDGDTRETIESHLAFFRQTGRTLKADTRYLMRDLRKTLRQARRIVRQAERENRRIENIRGATSNRDGQGRQPPDRPAGKRGHRTGDQPPCRRKTAVEFSLRRYRQFQGL